MDIVQEMLVILHSDKNYASENEAIFDNDSEEETITHYGTPRRSGRYPWGSGDNAYQHGSGDFLSRVDEMRKNKFAYVDEAGKKWSGDTAIAKSMGLTTSQFRTEIGIVKDERRMLQVDTAKRLRDKEGLGATEIGRKMGISESTVRSLLDSKSEVRMRKARETADALKKIVDEKEMVDIGAGVEIGLNITREKLNQALYLLEKDGYHVYKGGIPQPTNQGKQTNQAVLCKPGIQHKEIYEFDRVQTLDDYISRDDGKSLEKKFNYPESMDSKRLMIRYKEDGGIEKDGIVELRRNVDDLSLGEKRYSQVRILVDGKKYIKGMAVYGDDKDFPPGVDVIFNTNKDKSVSKLEVLKDIKDDPDNPFGSSIKEANQGGQYWYTDKATGERKLGLVNKRADEGDWNDWKDTLPAQFLSKQSKSMAEKQLALTRADKMAEYDKICSLENPTIKKHLLYKFADECDSAAVHLKAAALPGQKYHVIIPITSMKDTEVYAPNYENGTKVALVRYPHGGTFEIPILTVNNKQPLAKKLLGPTVTDAVGINSTVAERLSGADFDGDTVMVIPTHDHNGRVRITSTPRLDGLEGFDPKMRYPERPNMRYMKDPKTGKDSTQLEMGRISNLISDMTLAGADEKELARAVRHSMVVIDAAKHKLDYKRSEADNDIASLRKSYQGKTSGGASTIISRASRETSVPKRQGTPRINIKGTKDYDPTRPEGALIYKTADDLYYPVRKYDKNTGIVSIKTVSGKQIEYDVNDEDSRQRYTPVKREDPRTGKVRYTDSTGEIEYKIKQKTQRSTEMADTGDAYSLVSPARHPMEIIYADHANSMKALANRARKEMMSTKEIEISKTAKQTYKAEVDSLKVKLNNAKVNAIKERAAIRQANAVVNAKMKDRDLTKSEIKKENQRAVSAARQSVGSVSRRDRNIAITDREWEAIQAGAIGKTTLKQILENTDVDTLKQRAMPRASKQVSSAQISRMKSLAASNYTLEEIARKMGTSPSTVSKYLKGAK